MRPHTGHDVLPRSCAGGTGTEHGLTARAKHAEGGCAPGQMLLKFGANSQKHPPALLALEPPS